MSNEHPHQDGEHQQRRYARALARKKKARRLYLFAVAEGAEFWIQIQDDVPNLWYVPPAVVPCDSDGGPRMPFHQIGALQRAVVELEVELVALLSSDSPTDTSIRRAVEM